MSARDSTPDEALVARMAAGDERALGELYDRLGGLAYSLAFRILGDAADAEEAVADAFLQVWSSAAGFTAERASVAGWLSIITRTRALDRLRARRRRAAATERAASRDDEGYALQVASIAPPPDRSAEANEVRQTVAAALARLPDAQRQALELAFFAGLSHSEIARQLNEPLGTVKTRIRAALDKLRLSLAAHVLVE
jgi:RNA polymerase sigma-70 factor (ECF subfamily)